MFTAQHLDIVAPAPDEQEFIHEKYTAELLQNSFLPRTRYVG